MLCQGEAVVMFVFKHAQLFRGTGGEDPPCCGTNLCKGRRSNEATYDHISKLWCVEPCSQSIYTSARRVNMTFVANV